MGADIRVVDRGEDISLMEPMVIGEGSRHSPEITELALDLAQKSAGFRRSLPPPLADSLAALVRSMNCYYSNLIEGHDTHPIDIERALKNDYSQDAQKRDLQLEARAHIEVQAWIDEGGLTAEQALQPEGIRALHRRFCELLPPDLLKVNNPDTGKVIAVVPGEFRKDEVRVGHHVAISAGAVPRFVSRFADVYGRCRRGELIIAAAAAHHRLLWIHPFADGNGRVARLMSHAILRDCLDSGALWSVARGLARSSAEYKRLLAACDLTRRNSLDGRGSMSEEALAAFTRYFLTTCIDQVGFMERLVEPDRLRVRILQWTDEEVSVGMLPQQARRIVEAILYRGEISRADATGILGVGERQSRRVITSLLQAGVLVSDSVRQPLRLAFMAAHAQRWLPGLFPGHVSND